MLPMVIAEAFPSRSRCGRGGGGRLPGRCLPFLVFFGYLSPGQLLILAFLDDGVSQLLQA